MPISSISIGTPACNQEYLQQGFSGSPVFIFKYSCTMVGAVPLSTLTGPVPRGIRSVIKAQAESKSLKTYGSHMEKATNNHLLTKERLAELKEELEELKTVRRIEIAQQLKKAKELGDLSENAEYAEAREEKDRIEGRISELEDIIKNSAIIKKAKNQETVVIGSTVEVARNGKKLSLSIVGSHEAKPEAGRISNESPLGKALLGRRAGETISIDTPNGAVSYEIAAIE